jgi:P27 family predicted phage terminase small subunit
LKFVGPATAATRPQRRVRKGHPERPPELTGEAAAEWDRLAPELDAAGLLAVVDRGILSAYCFAVADMLAARDAVMTHGRWVSQPVQNARGEVLGSKWVEHPAVKLLADASRRIERLGAALGLTPAARDRMEGGAPAGESTGPGNRVVALRDRIQAARNGG